MHSVQQFLIIEQSLPFLLSACSQLQLYCIAGFLRVKFFMNCPCPDFQGENFQESSITLSAYYIILTPANIIILFNNYIAHFLVQRSLLRWSLLYRDATFTRMYGPLQLELRDYTYSSNLKQFLLYKDNLAKSWQNAEWYTMVHISCLPLPSHMCLTLRSLCPLL